jgi:hypothetical protein
MLINFLFLESPTVDVSAAVPKLLADILYYI